MDKVIFNTLKICVDYYLELLILDFNFISLGQKKGAN